MFMVTVGTIATFSVFLTAPMTVYVPFESKYPPNSLSGIHTSALA